MNIYLAYFILWAFGTVVFATIIGDGDFGTSVAMSLALQAFLVVFATVLWIVVTAFETVF